MDEDRQVLLQLLGRAETARSSQNTAVWTTVSVFAAAQAILAQSLAVSGTNRAVHFWLSAIGLVVSLFATLLVDRMLRFLVLYEHQGQAIERDLGIVPLHLVTSRDNPLYTVAMGQHSWPAKFAIRYLFGIAAVAWFLFTAWFAFVAFSPGTATGATILAFVALSSGVGCVTTRSLGNGQSAVGTADGGTYPMPTNSVRSMNEDEADKRINELADKSTQMLFFLSVAVVGTATLAGPTAHDPNANADSVNQMRQAILWWGRAFFPVLLGVVPLKEFYMLFGIDKASWYRGVCIVKFLLLWAAVVLSLWGALHFVRGV